MRRLARPAPAAIVLVILGTLAPRAQQALSTQADVARQLDDARQMMRTRRFEEATTAYQAALDAARRMRLEPLEADALCGLGETFNKRGKYADAQPVLQQCLDLAERLHSQAAIGRASIALSQTAEMNGRYADAAALADRAVAAYDLIDDPRGRALARLQAIHPLRQSVDDEKAATDLIIADAGRVGDVEIEATALHSLGDAFFNSDRFEEAFETLSRARELYHQLGLFGDEGTTLNSLGRVYRAHGRLDEALKFQMQALALHEKYGSPFELMQSHNAVAVVLNQMDDFAAARMHYERALAIARESGSPRIQDFLDANLASLLVDVGEYETGARTLEAVVRRGLDAFPSRRYSNLSVAYMGLNRPEDALAAADHALASCGASDEQCIAALDARGNAYAALGNDTAALADLRTAMEKLEAARTRLVPSDFLKQNFNEVQREVYSSSIGMAFRRHDDRRSLETAELASSRAFLDLLATRQNQLPRSSAPSVTVRGAAGGTPDLSSHAVATPATAEDIVAIARRLGSTVLVYWPADQGVFVWLIRADGTIVSRRSDTTATRLLRLIHDTAPPEDDGAAPLPAAPRTAMTRGASQIQAGASSDHRAWRQLYDVLIAPIRQDLPHRPGALLTIIPHGALMNVSFAALQDRNGRYLVEDYAIHYAPAGAVLQFTAGMRRANARHGGALLVADPVTARRSALDPQLPPLPGAREEVQRIAALVPHARVTVLEGGTASEPRVVAAAEGKTVLHLATHAIVRDDAPNDSYLAFGPAGPASAGLLTARDVYDLRLTADLVVLSACRSGGGRVTGDGIATFARAFFYAGTASIVVSVWDVADEPTARMLPAFYQSWLAGASKARSLRRAQLQLLADLRAGAVRVETRAGPIVLPEHPVFWAGFVLVGEPD